MRMILPMFLRIRQISISSYLLETSNLILFFLAISWGFEFVHYRRRKHVISLLVDLHVAIHVWPNSLYLIVVDNLDHVTACTYLFS